MRATIRIVNTYFFKTFYGPFFAFIFPICFTFIMTSIWDLGGQIVPSAILPGCFSTIVITLSLISIPVTINDLRHSIFLKRMGASKIKPWIFMMTLTLYYYFIIIIAYWWQALWSLIILSHYHLHVISMFKHANYGEVFYTSVVTFLLAMSLGIVLLSFCKRNYQIQIIAVVIVILSIPLAGLGVPIILMHNHASNPPFTTKASYLDPFWYVSALNYESWYAKPDNLTNLHGSSIFDPSTIPYAKTIVIETIKPILNKVDKFLNLYLSLFLILVFSIIGIRTFKWNIR